MSNQTANYNTPTALTTNTFTRTGYTFTGWNTAANGSGTAYAAGATFTMGAANVTLYAQWTINSYTVTYSGNGSIGGTQSGISVGGSAITPPTALSPCLAIQYVPISPMSIADVFSQPKIVL